MASISYRRRHNLDIWPGFVDALAALLMVLIFLLLLFVISQVSLSSTISGKDKALASLQGTIEKLNEELNYNKAISRNLNKEVAELFVRSQELNESLNQLSEENSSLKLSKSEVEAELEKAKQVIIQDKNKIAIHIEQLSKLRLEVSALLSLKQELENNLSKLNLEKIKVEDNSLQAIAENQRLSVEIKKLREEINNISALLDASEERDKKSNAQIKSLGERLNKALAGKVLELAKYRSDFFGELRDRLSGVKGVTIKNDRFLLQNEVLFASASATLDDAGKKQVLKIATTLKAIANSIPENINWVLMIEGHTDSNPIRNSPLFPSNWELSMTRAISVLRIFLEAGIPRERIAAAGFADTKPVDINKTVEAYRNNRRIELRLTQR